MPKALDGYRPAERNGVKFPWVEEAILKKDKKGLTYPTIRVTKDNLNDAITFAGADAVANLVQQKFNTLAQALYFDKSISKLESKLNPTSGKEVEQVIETDVEKLVSQFERFSASTGISLGVLQARHDELSTEMVSYIDGIQAATPGSEEFTKIVKRLGEIKAELIETKKAMDERSAMFKERLAGEEEAD